jgi:hypothetical protein
MGTTARPDPWVYATWITGVVAGEKHCLFAPWIQSHFKIAKVERDFDLVAWKIEHTEMLVTRAAQLESAGWTVYLEDQNDFRLKGTAATLSGKCDLVATRGDEARVEDCKSGQQRDADFVQVLLYMVALPLLAANTPRPTPMALAVDGKRLTGAIVYRTHLREIQPEECTPALRQRILDTVKRMGDHTPPARVPSAAECRYCSVSKSDCPDRIELDDAVTTVELF